MIWLAAQLWPAALLSLVLGFLVTWFTVVKPRDKVMAARAPKQKRSRLAKRSERDDAVDRDVVSDDSVHGGEPFDTEDERDAAATAPGGHRGTVQMASDATAASAAGAVRQHVGHALSPHEEPVPTHRDRASVETVETETRADDDADRFDDSAPSEGRESGRERASRTGSHPYDVRRHDADDDHPSFPGDDEVTATLVETDVEDREAGTVEDHHASSVAAAHPGAVEADAPGTVEDDAPDIDEDDTVEPKPRRPHRAVGVGSAFAPRVED